MRLGGVDQDGALHHCKPKREWVRGEVQRQWRRVRRRRSPRHRLFWSYLKSRAWFELPAAETLPPTVGVGVAASATWGARGGQSARRVLRGGSGTKREAPMRRPGPASHTIDHDWLLKMLRLRIDDRAFLGRIRKWLKAGILETDGRVIHPDTGTPQGAYA